MALFQSNFYDLWRIALPEWKLLVFYDFWNLAGLTKQIIIPKVANSKAKATKGMTNAYIFEQAAAMVGGEQFLRSAVQRGAVMVHKEGGMELFSFPSRQTSVKDKVEQVVTSRAEGGIGESQHTEIKAWR